MFAALHYDDVIMIMLASQITSLTIVYSTVYSDVNQRKHQSSASLAFVWEIHRGPVNFPHKGPVTRKMFPFDDVIMLSFMIRDELVISCSAPSLYLINAKCFQFGTNFCEIQIKIQKILFKETLLKMKSNGGRIFCPGLNVHYHCNYPKWYYFLCDN